MRSLRWKILLTCVVIVFIPIYLLNRHALEFFDWFARTDLENQLKHHAFMVGTRYRDLAGEGDPARREAFESWLRGGAAEIGARIQVTDLQGRVLHDSDSSPEIGRSLADRPEIEAALAGGYSARARLTADRRFMYFHIARPVKDEARRTLAVVYVTRHSDPIVQAIQRMVQRQRVATALALGLAALAALVLSLTLTRRLRALRRSARRFAAGEGPLDPPLPGGDEIAQLDRALHAMADQLAARQTYNRDFVSTTLHELRTPLTAIRGAAELLRDGAGDEPRARQRFVGNILYQAERLTRIVGELRELTRLDAEAPTARGELMDYGAFVRAALARMEETFPQSHAAVTLELPAEPVSVVMVPHRLEQVLSNLLDNALRYTPVTGSVKITVAVTGDRRVRTTVADTGCGITSENMPRIFDRFFTTERHIAPIDHGSGLGLALARSIIQHHRGRIWAESPPDGGARLCFELQAG